MKRRTLLKLTLALPAALAISVNAHAQDWPSQPIRLISPSPSGGAADVATRLIAKHLSELVGQPVIVDNRPGGNGVVAGLEALRGGKDGYSVFMGSTTTLVANPYLMKHVPFDPATDFVPVAMVASLPFVLVVNPSLPVKSVKEFIAYAKDRPGKVTFGSANATSLVAASTFNQMAGIEMFNVPYKGAPASLTDVVGGEIDSAFVDYSTARALIQSNRLRLLAVTSAKRSPLMPQTPTLSESGLPGYEVIGWTAMSVPAGVHPSIVQRLNREMQKILSRKDVQEQLATLGQDYILKSPEEFASFLRTERPRWARMIRNAGIKPD
ncbi:tripartite tricarboxylate transporter substrate binding protein [Variovorax sp. J31P207]|uniref:Bug family tripartite tricarboxylate transporter substrate binding protein n=1 Tax=Variovorax sp. J31P207 TaxID=3053510 RepID=UPI0025776866|nr:tripartite tricarboxylate transporter substrate binding protein [Variovorax sp. J31P207]MDM0069981.1 tripartite tricarboxylate transporter substrate binding protein [Variovorax sp. J31P207]